MKKLIILALLILFIGAVNAREVLEINSDFEGTDETMATCGGATQCTCGGTLRSDQVMWYDMSCPALHAIVIAENDITLDCNGHTITGGFYGNEGIIAMTKENITIKNCVITGFDKGIEITDSNNVTILDSNITDNEFEGIFLDKIKDSTLSGNTLTENYPGIWLENSQGNELSSNTITECYNGIILISNSSFNTLWNNNFVNNTQNDAWEISMSNSNDWNFGTQGNYWDNFESNPGYPNYYEIFGDGDGIDWHPNAEPEIFECGMWGDVTGDGAVNPLDVSYLVNYVYKQRDARVQPPNCPYEAGDVTCGGGVNPLDVSYMVKFVYKQLYAFCDPCEGLPNCNVTFPAH